MPLADGPIGTPSPAARDRWGRGTAIQRDPGQSTDPLPRGFDDLRLLASVILRQVRATHGTANAAVHVARSTPSSSTRSRCVDGARRFGRRGPADWRPPITEGGSSVPVHLLFAELAGRRVHGVTREGRSA
jgi:hypothetical protein